MRIQDRQLANVEMMPGGFDQLRRLHQTVDAAVAPTDREQPSATPERPVVAAPAEDAAADAANPFIALLRPPEGAAPGPSARPAPNPWAARPPPPAPAANPFASLFGGGGGSGSGSGSMVPPAMPPFGGAMGGVPGPEQLAQVDGLIAALEANPVRVDFSLLMHSVFILSLASVCFSLSAHTRVVVSLLQGLRQTMEAMMG